MYSLLDIIKGLGTGVYGALKGATTSKGSLPTAGAWAVKNIPQSNVAYIKDNKLNTDAFIKDIKNMNSSYDALHALDQYLLSSAAVSKDPASAIKGIQAYESIYGKSADTKALTKAWQNVNSKDTSAAVKVTQTSLKNMLKNTENPYDAIKDQIQGKVKETPKTSGGASTGGNSAPSLSAFRREMEGLLREPKPDPLPEWAFNLDDFANHFGLMLKYEDILKEKEAATDAKFKEYDTQAQRAEHGVLRAQDAAYDQYLQGLRNQTANAVSTGAMRGANQANALAEMLAMQQGNKETGTAFSDLMFDLMQQRGTAREEDKLWARDLEQQRRFKIADYEQGRYATLVNDRVGDLNYAGAVNAAGLNALGYYMQGLASAAGTRDAARIGTQGQMQAQQDQWDKALAGLTAGNKMSVNEAMNRLGYSQLLGTSGTFDPKAYDKFWNN